MTSIEKNEKLESLFKILKGSLISVGITLIFLFIFALILTYTNVQENTINPVIIIITFISILIGSSISTLKMRKNGLINGGFIGLIYILLIYLISSLTGSGFSLGMYTLIMIISAIFSGMLGGIIGVNFNR